VVCAYISNAIAFARNLMVRTCGCWQAGKIPERASRQNGRARIQPFFLLHSALHMARNEVSLIKQREDFNEQITDW
jgi:hypothetical protein